MFNMSSVIVCVVLAIAWDVNSSVIRTRRDLEQNIYEAYGSPPTPRDHHPPIPPTLDHNTARSYVEQTTVSVPQNILDDIWGSPGKSEPDPESSAPPLYSAIISNVNNSRPTGEQDLNNMSPPPEDLTAMENSTSTNKTGMDFEDRFMGPSMLQEGWNRNFVTPATLPISRQAGIPQKHVQPEPPSEEPPQPLEPGKDRTLLEPGPFEHRPVEPRHRPDHMPTLPVPGDAKPLEPKLVTPKPSESKSSANNASDKSYTFNSLLLVLVLFVLKV